MNWSVAAHVDWWRVSQVGQSTTGSVATDCSGSTDGSESAGDSGSGSPSQASAERVDHEDEIVFPTPTSEDCRYISYDTSTKCGTYRPCDSCLRKQGCRIGLSGLCELDTSDGTNLSAIYDYRLAFDLHLTLPAALKLNETALLANQMWIFPATHASYCPADDTICQLCIKKKFWLNDGTDSRFCVGNTATNSAGQLCVCVSNCASSANATYCPLSAEEPVVKATKDDWWRRGLAVAIIVILGAIILCGILWLGCCCIRRRRAQRKAEADTLQAQLAIAGMIPAIPADGYFEEESGRSVEL